MAKSYLELHLKYENIFNITSINGIALEGSDFQFGPSKYNLRLEFLRTEIVPVQTSRGVQYALAHPLRVFHLDTSTKLSNFNIDTVLSTYNKSLIVQSNFQPLKCSFRLETTPRASIIPTFTAQLTLPKFSFIYQLSSPNFGNSTNFHINFSLFDKLGVQLVKTNNFDLSYAILASGKISQTQYSLCYMHNKINYLILRSKIKPRDNFVAGVKFQIDQNLNPLLLASYKMKTNGYLVHSLINSEGDITTYLKKEITNHFDCIFTMSVNHRDSNYQSGFGLLWHQPED